MTPSDNADIIDGRTARRDRNRRAVLDAIINLIEEGNPAPTVAEISERSGTSHRSLFRYFDDLDSLFAEAVLSAYERYAPLSRIHRFGQGDLEERVANVVAQRLALFDAMAPLVDAGRRRRGALDPMDAAMRHYMLGPMRDQLGVHFASELQAIPEDERGAVLDGLEALLSLDAFEYMRRSELDDERIAAAYRAGIRRLLG